MAVRLHSVKRYRGKEKLQFYVVGQFICLAVTREPIAAGKLLKGTKWRICVRYLAECEGEEHSKKEVSTEKTKQSDREQQEKESNFFAGVDFIPVYSQIFVKSSSNLEIVFNH